MYAYCTLPSLNTSRHMLASSLMMSMCSQRLSPCSPALCSARAGAHVQHRPSRSACVQMTPPGFSALCIASKKGCKGRCAVSPRLAGHTALTDAKPYPLKEDCCRAHGVRGVHYDGIVRGLRCFLHPPDAIRDVQVMPWVRVGYRQLHTASTLAQLALDRASPAAFWRLRTSGKNCLDTSGTMLHQRSGSAAAAGGQQAASRQLKLYRRTHRSLPGLCAARWGSARPRVSPRRHRLPPLAPWWARAAQLSSVRAVRQASQASCVLRADAPRARTAAGA